MKVCLYFKNYKLGELTYDNGLYIYNSNTEGEIAASIFPSMTLYGLENSNNKVSSSLFPIFQNIVDEVSQRKDILTLINFQSNDNPFTLLTKYGKVLQNNKRFYVIAE